MLNESRRQFNWHGSSFFASMHGLSNTHASEESMSLPLVFIDGDAGTTGLQVRERLSGRSDLRLIGLPDEQRKQPARRAEALNDCDLAVLCLPDAAAREAVAMLRRPGVRLLDASSAHRTAPGWAYGFAELSPQHAQALHGAQRVSNPGCYPTGMLALVRPLVAAGLLPPELPLVVHAASGYSGRGREGIVAHEGPDAAKALPYQVYGLSLRHKHVAEMQQHAGLTHAPLFVPAYGGWRQGIVVTIGLHRRQLPAAASAEALQAALAMHYQDAPEIEVSPLASDPGSTPSHLDPQACNGTNRLRLSVFAHPDNGQILLAAVFDNLGKGAAGAAVQNLERMLGLSTPGPLH
jgi:N-acetyl-gamma-glutamyl-phosphate reductase